MNLSSIKVPLDSIDLATEFRSSTIGTRPPISFMTWPLSLQRFTYQTPVRFEILCSEPPSVTSVNLLVPASVAALIVECLFPSSHINEYRVDLLSVTV